jgi:hypothetical protein
MMITLVILASCYVIFRISVRFWTNPTPGIIAAFAFATSFPVLININRIQPDPLAVMFMLISLLFSWKFIEVLEEGDNKTAFFNLVVSAVTATSACFSKFMFGIPWLVGLFLYLFLFKHRQFRGFSQKFIPAITFTTASILTGLLWSTKMNWENFIIWWADFLSGGKAQVDAFTLSDLFLQLKIVVYQNLSYVIHKIRNVNIFSQPSVTLDINKFSYDAEFIYIVITIIGVWLFFRKSNENRSKFYSLLLLFIFSIPVSFYRPAPHYFLIHMAVMSIPFAYAIFFFSNNFLSAKLTSSKKLFLLCSLVFLIHYTSIVFTFNTKLSDINSYSHGTKPFYRALQSIDYGEKIGVVSKDVDIIMFGGGFWDHAPKELRGAFFTIFKPFSSLEEAMDASDEIRYIGYFEKGRKAIVIPVQVGE